MQALTRMFGDGLSIAALAIIFSLSFGLHQRLRADVRIPFYFQRSGEPGPRVGKVVGLWGFPVLSIVLLFLPTAVGATFTYEGQEAVMLMFLRFTVSAALALRHVVFMKALFELMEREGELSP
jgi:hypothetical protein